MAEQVALPAHEDRLLLVRHGQTAWNAAGRMQGHADIGLDDVGREQAMAAAPVIAAAQPLRLWASDLARARQTAETFAAATGSEVVPDPRFREYAVGARQGLTIPEFAERFPTEHAAWSADGGHLGGGVVPGAESPDDVEARFLPAIEECWKELAELGGGTGVVVSHGAAIKLVTTALLGWPRPATLDLLGLGNCRAVDLRRDGARVRLAAYNLALAPE